MSIETFASAYMECALWSSIDEDGEALDARYDTGDIDPKSFVDMFADCVDFYEAYSKTFAAVLSDEQAGHDFWLTRNGHGAGFWDRGLGKLGDTLTDAAHGYGSSDLYVGDDGKVYAS